MQKGKDKKHKLGWRLAILGGLASFFIGILIAQAGNILDFINPGKEYVWQSQAGYYNGSWSDYSSTYHSGIDLNVTKDGDKLVSIASNIDKYGNVYAVADGIVSFSEDRIKCKKEKAEDGKEKKNCYLSGFGKHIGVRHALTNGEVVESHYAHLSKRLAKKGEEVKKGDLIGVIGKTGGNFGIHLHFEIRKIDPKRPMSANRWVNKSLSEKEQQQWIADNFYDPIPFIRKQHALFTQQTDQEQIVESQPQPTTVSTTITQQQTTKGSLLSRLWGKINNFFNNTYSKLKITFSLTNPSITEQTKSENESLASKLEAKLPEVSEPPLEPIWNAELIGQNNIDSLMAGEIAELQVKYKNSGNQNFTPENVSLNIYGDDAARFYHSSWLTKKRPVAIFAEVVESGQIAGFKFQIQAPTTAGIYRLAFRPVYQTGYNFEWLSDDVAKWQFKVVETVAEKDNSNKEDVVVKGIEFEENLGIGGGESQKPQESKSQENNTTDNNQDQHNNSQPKLNNDSNSDNQPDTLEVVVGNNQSAGRGGGFVYTAGDGTPPQAVTLTFPAELLYFTNQTILTLVGEKASDVARINININNKEVILTDFIDENNWQYELELIQEENLITFVAQDLAQNQSEPIVLAIGLDTLAPMAPIITTNGGSNFTTGYSTITLEGTKQNDADFVFIDSEAAEIIDAASWQMELSLIEGENLVEIFTQDLAGNISEMVNLIITYDNSLLTINLIDKPPALTNQTGANFAFTVGVEVDQFYCQLDADDETGCDSPWTVEDLTEGWHQFNLRTDNEAINSISYQWLVDTTLPADPEFVLNNSNEWTNQPEVAVVVTPNDEAAFWLITGNSLTPTVDDVGWQGTTPAIFTLSGSDGEKAVYLWIKDEAGNINFNTVSQTITLDQIVPTCEVADLSSEQTTENFNLTINTADDFGVASWTVEYQNNDGEWQIWVNDSIEEVIEFSGIDGQTYGFRCQAIDLAGNLSGVSEMADTATIINLPPAVVINEIAWMGTTTAASTADKWLELYNNTNQDIDLSEWSIFGADAGKCLNLIDADGSAGFIISQGGYFIYANDSETVNETVNDAVGSSLVDVWDAAIGLNNTNSGKLRLFSQKDCLGEPVDEVDNSGNWLASDNSTKATMERVDSIVDGSLASNWQTNNRVVINGLTADNKAINGTPGKQNSASLSLGQMTIIDNNINSDTTWSAVNNPYVVIGEIVIAANKQLTVEAGTIVKFMPAAKLIFAEGGLPPSGEPAFKVLGTAGNEVVFTSIYDDTYGGDTTGNGSEILPQAGDWGGFVFNNFLMAELQNTIIRYGQNIEINMAVLTMNNVEMTNNLGGVKVLHPGAGVKISNSNLNNLNYNIDNSFNGDFITDPMQGDYSYSASMPTPM